MPVLHEHSSIRTGADLNTYKTTGDYAVSAPSNGPAGGDYQVSVRTVHAEALYQVFESGSILFTSVADTDDTITIFDGVNTTVFTFKVAGDNAVGATVQVTKGATAANSAQNFKAAVLANTHIHVTPSGAGATITLVNAQSYFGGSITKSDGDNDYTITAFTGGNDGLRILQTATDLSTHAAESRMWTGAAWGSWA